MKKLLLGSTMLIGAGSLASGADASDGIKLDVGGFFRVVYAGIFDSKNAHSDFGAQHNYDHFINNSEVHFKGETTLDNGLTVGARIELEGLDNAVGSHGQIDESFVYWSGGFGKVQIGSSKGAIADYCLLPPGATTNFSAWSPAAWGSNDPIGSNATCLDTEGHSQKIVYTTPSFSGFQLRVSYTPSNHASLDSQPGVNGHGANTNPAATAHHSFTTYATYTFAGDGWGVNWAGGGSWQTEFNRTKHGNDGTSADYQTDLNVMIGPFGIGGILEYYDTGGSDNNAYVFGGGASYTFDAFTLGLQGSHGHYNGTGLGFAADPSGSRNLNRIIATGNYAMAPGIKLDAELGYTWFHDTGTASSAGGNNSRYHAFDVSIGSAFTF
jgi:hypothetical protein